MSTAYKEAGVDVTAGYEAVNLMKKVPDYEFSNELLSEYSEYLEAKKSRRSRVGVTMMIILGVLVVLLALVPPVSQKIIDSIDNSANLVYIDVNGEYSVTSNSYAIINVKIEESYKDAAVSNIANDAFNGCTKLRTVEIPNTVNYIGAQAFMNCKSLKKIIFNGTRMEWHNIEKVEGWDMNISEDYEVVCIDGIYSEWYFNNNYYDDYYDDYWD